MLYQLNPRIYAWGFGLFWSLDQSMGQFVMAICYFSTEKPLSFYLKIIRAIVKKDFKFGSIYRTLTLIIIYINCIARGEI